jgi:hypothetical protein
MKFNNESDSSHKNMINKFNIQKVMYIINKMKII